MANIILSGTMVRYPLGGMNLWLLAWLKGIKSLGHNIHFVEKSLWEHACFDVPRKIMTNDCSYGVSVVNSLFEQYGLGNNWCFVDLNGDYYGMSKKQVEKAFNNADLFLDLEWGEWEEEAARIPLRVFVDGEPGWFQMKLTKMIEKGISLPNYHFYFTHGRLIGTKNNHIPTSGIEWQHTLPPALISQNKILKLNTQGPFTTVMNWKSNKEINYQGKNYGQKDIEFNKFIQLPSFVNEKMEVAVSGSDVPWEKLKKYGWQVKNADDVSQSVKSYLHYIKNSKAEFSVAKNVFVETNSGWFGDRPVYYMSFGKPAIVQETGWTKNLPNGQGLFSFTNMDDAIESVLAINENYEMHSKWAHDIAFEYFEASHVIGKILNKVGI